MNTLRQIIAATQRITAWVTCGAAATIIMEAVMREFHGPFWLRAVAGILAYAWAIDALTQGHAFRSWAGRAA